MACSVLRPGDGDGLITCSAMSCHLRCRSGVVLRGPGYRSEAVGSFVSAGLVAGQGTARQPPPTTVCCPWRGSSSLLHQVGHPTGVPAHFSPALGQPGSGHRDVPF